PAASPARRRAACRQGRAPGASAPRRARCGTARTGLPPPVEKEAGCTGADMNPAAPGRGKSGAAGHRRGEPAHALEVSGELARSVRELLLLGRPLERGGRGVGGDGRADQVEVAGADLALVA